jgi:hypothetical protein
MELLTAMFPTASATLVRGWTPHVNASIPYPTLVLTFEQHAAP